MICILLKTDCGISREQSLNIVKRQTTFEGPGTEGEDKYVDGFIIGGVNARQGRWPWMASSTPN